MNLVLKKKIKRSRNNYPTTIGKRTKRRGREKKQEIKQQKLQARLDAKEQKKKNSTLQQVGLMQQSFFNVIYIMGIIFEHTRLLVGL